MMEQFVNKLHNHPNCSEFLHEFLNLIYMDMLNVHPHGQHSRVKIGPLTAKLATMHRKCLDDHQYALNPVPWKSR